VIVIKSAQFFDDENAPQYRNPLGKPDFSDVDVRRLDGQLHDSKGYIEQCIVKMNELLATNPNISLHEVVQLFSYEFQMIVPFHEYLGSA